MLMAAPQSASDQAQSAGQNAADQTQGAASSAADQTKGAASSAAGAVKHGAETGATKTEEGASDASHGAENTQMMDRRRADQSGTDSGAPARRIKLVAPRPAVTQQVARPQTVAVAIPHTATPLPLLGLLGLGGLSFGVWKARYFRK